MGGHRLPKGARLLRSYLKSSGLGPVELAVALGCSRQMIHALCKGYNRPSIQLAIQIQEYTEGVVPCEVWK